MIKIAPRFFNRFNKLFFNSKVWLIVTIVSSVLICISITWVYYQQKQTLNQERLILQNIRLARIDLAKGFLQITLANNSSSPFKEEVGFAYLKQAISSFKNDLHINEIYNSHKILLDDKEILNDFNNNIKIFQQNLIDYFKEGEHNPKLETTLRINYSDIERQAGQIDTIIKKDLNELSSDLDNKFFTTIFIAAFLLLSICITLYYIIIKNEKYIKELLISEIELSKQRYLFEIMFNSINDGIIITNKKREIILANKGVETTFGYKPDDLIGKSSKILYAKNEKYEKAGKTVFDENSLTQNNQYITYYKDKSNKEFPGETFGAKLFNSNGEWIGNFKIMRDISERMQFIEDIQKAKLKAEENDKLKSAFLANISHEIRTPMNSILGFSDLLMNQDLTEAKQEKYHEIVNACGKRLMNLINDIVDVSKIDAKEMELNPTVFNLNKQIDQLQHQFLISPKNVNTVISTVKTIPENDSFIKCDEMRLAQVLSNLLENALKFTHNGTVEFGYKLGIDEVQFFVKDSGVGINEKDQQLIFERFGKSDNEILKVKEGSGLGLSISKGIVKLFGGKIWVESEPYKGATFYFTIPNCILMSQEDKKEAEKTSNIVTDVTKTILIAEDEDTNFWYIEAALDGQPFNLIHVVNGKEAVEIMQSNNNIDLILMDFNMPIMNGIEATKEIRKTNTTIPIIAVTAYAMMADKEKSLAIGCTDYLSKPVSRDLLIETINKYT